MKRSGELVQVFALARARELFDRLAESKDPLETLSKLRGSVEFRKKKEMLSEIYSSRAERRR
jgi:hypothetical protein